MKTYTLLPLCFVSGYATKGYRKTTQGKDTMNRQEQKEWAKNKVQALCDQYAAQVALFNDCFDNGDHSGTQWYSKRRKETMQELLAFIE